MEKEFHALSCRLFLSDDAIETMVQLLGSPEQALETELDTQLAAGLAVLKKTVVKHMMENIFSEKTAEDADDDEDDESEASIMASVGELGADAAKALVVDAAKKLLEKVCVKVHELSKPLLHEFAQALGVQCASARRAMRRGRAQASAAKGDVEQGGADRNGKAQNKAREVSSAIAQNKARVLLSKVREVFTRALDANVRSCETSMSGSLLTNLKKGGGGFRKLKAFATEFENCCSALPG